MRKKEPFDLSVALFMSYSFLFVVCPFGIIFSGIFFIVEGGAVEGIVALIFIVLFIASLTWVKRTKRELKKHEDDRVRAFENSPLFTVQAKVFGKTTKSSGGGWQSDGDSGGWIIPMKSLI